MNGNSEWYPIPGYTERYEINIKGIIRSKFGQKLKKKHILLKDGYVYVKVWFKGKCQYLSVHRLLAINFISNPYNLPSINHINGLKSDNRLENLEWVSPKQNSEHYIRFIKKDNLNSEIVIAIYIEFIKGESIANISNKFKLQKSNIRSILNGSYQWLYTHFEKSIKNEKCRRNQDINYKGKNWKV